MSSGSASIRQLLARRGCSRWRLAVLQESQDDEQRFDELGFDELGFNELKRSSGKNVRSSGKNVRSSGKSPHPLAGGITGEYRQPFTPSEELPNR